MSTKLFFIIQKNLRLVFRNWVTFLILVLGPLFLIGIVGYAFSGDTLHDIQLGVSASKGAPITDVVSSLSSDGVTIIHFPSSNRCIYAMNHSAVDICAVFSEDFGNQTGSITFYYDPTRYNLVRYILEYVQKQIAMSSDQVSLAATEQIIQDIAQFVEEMKTGQQQIHDLQEQAVLLREDLVDAHEDVVHAQEIFVPQYTALKEQQALFNSSALAYADLVGINLNATDLAADLTTLNGTLTTLNTTVFRLENVLSMNGTNRTSYNASLFILFYDSITTTQTDITATVTVLELTQNASVVTINQTLTLLSELDTVIVTLDTINTSLATTEQELADHIVAIDQGIASLDSLSASFDSYIMTFSAINQSDAEQLLHPITATFIPVPEAIAENKIALVFPMILVFMISFISLLLANMLVLNETNSPAYFRNFLVPVFGVLFVLGLFVTAFILLLLQLLVFFLVAYFSFGIDFFMNFPVFLFGVALTIVLFTLLGLLFGYSIRDRQTSLLFTLFFSLIMFFFSDIIFPIELMPEAAAFVAQFNPLVVAENIFRETLFFGHGIAAQWFGFSVLGLYVIVCSFFVLIAYYWNRRQR